MDGIDDIRKIMKEFSPMLDSWWPYVIGLVLGLLAALRNYMVGPMCPSDERIDGKIVVITGGSSGIGRETALELAHRGGHIILAVRNLEAGESVAKIINGIPGARVMEAFGQSKLALIMMARHMRTKLKDTNVTINAVNPGLVRNTKHLRNSLLTTRVILNIMMLPFLWLLTKNPRQGAQTTVYAAVASELSNRTGKYLNDCEIKSPAENAVDDDIAEKLYEKSMILVQPFMQTNLIESEVGTEVNLLTDLAPNA